MTRASPPLPPAPPAWREPMVWLIVGGPLTVVVASFITLALALRHPDRPLQLHVQAPAAAEGGASADPVPALMGRNHAATGTPGAPR
ncbi:MAG: hypothetical protein ACK4R2_02100 [Roseateles sp.]